MLVKALTLKKTIHIGVNATMTQTLAHTLTQDYLSGPLSCHYGWMTHVKVAHISNTVYSNKVATITIDITPAKMLSLPHRGE